MTPPMAKGPGNSPTSRPQPAVLSCPDRDAAQRGPGLSVLTKRADFLRAAKALRQGTPGFLLQARARADESGLIRVGFTCSKKIGNSVTRNRAKRRLREIARALLPRLGHAGWDYVLVGRPGATTTRAFPDLMLDLESALARIHPAGNPPIK